MERLHGGDVLMLLMRKDILNVDEARCCVAETDLAFESIQKSSYIHRDNKHGNLLLDRYGHSRLSYFVLCKPLDCGTLQEQEFSVGDNVIEILETEERSGASIRIQQ
ncbi:hypothetical protein V6N13_134262 [Hibiscus sabdariffa]|uniref:non-specific serine/threonine protein kinase n=1 Tax=Hibiscus sabdariffa TaxID=183260 RepID=A0ABR2R3P5_9ROSI